jgi:hypothetical protein
MNGDGRVGVAVGKTGGAEGVLDGMHAVSRTARVIHLTKTFMYPKSF